MMTPPTQNYLRGVQELDASGTATFTSIFPAAYSGRWPHIHFAVYSDVANAVSSGPSSTSLQQDMVFGDDGGIHQIASMSGSASAG